jgi:hypothetical protein
MTKIIKLNEKPEDFIGILKDKDLLIYEDIQGAQVFVKYDGSKFIIRPKSIKSEDLNFIDLAIQKFYSSLFVYLHTLPNYVTNLLSPTWWFCFEYFPDNQPAHIEYKKTPLNNLILTCIVKGSKYVYNYEEIVEYAKLFDVDPLPVIFKGKLNDKQLEIISLFLNTSEKDLKYVFGEENFAYFFYQLLNPQLDNSFLMDDFNSNLEKIIIKIDNNSKYSFELLNPAHQRLKLSNKTEYLENYTLIILNFLEYLQLKNYKDIKLENITKDELYIEIICKIFNEYITNIKKDVEEWNISIPTFFKDDKFRINTDLIKDKKTKEYIKSNNKIEYVFKVILGSFSHKKKKPIGILNKKTIEHLNKEIENISQHIDRVLKINREYYLSKNDLLDFKDYFKVNYNTDADNMIYPDVFQAVLDDDGEVKKKKGKKGVPDMGKKKFGGFDDFDDKMKF